MKRELNSFFNPKTIAVVGASNNPHKVGNILMKKISKFRGKVIPINLKHKKILRKKTYPSIKECPKKIDLVIIAIPSKSIQQIIEECGEKQIKNVIVISAGFSETGNTELEKKIIQTAKKYNINLLGPNCFGIANPYLNLDTTFASNSVKKGSIAFVSQSGALWSDLSDLSLGRKQGFSKFVSLGNMADINFCDILEYLQDDKKTKIIILYIEKLNQGKRFIEICKKSKKEIIAIKAGKTEKGSKATISHTGSLATDFKIYQGAFKQSKIKLANSLFSAFNYTQLKIKPAGRKVLIITNAGGAGSLMTDYCVQHGLKIIKPPIDLLGTASAKDYKKILRKIKNKDFYDSVIVILTPQKMSEPEKTAKEIIKFSKTKPIIACFLGENSIKKAKALLEKKGVLCFTQLENAAEVLSISI
ncbi:MAG: CoA-binding protein [Nanoarchaeota archaeon]|nr:CoA-binding protein [Nanoarchaeota archaeon]